MTAESKTARSIQKVNIPDSWVYQDTVDFSFEISDTINLLILSFIYSMVMIFHTKIYMCGYHRFPK